MKKDLEKRIKDLNAEVGRAKFYLERVEGRLNALTEELLKLEEKKPRVYFNDKAPDNLLGFRVSSSPEIEHYTKHSDKFIEFEALGFSYRYIESYITNQRVFPLEGSTYVKITKSKPIFEIYDFVAKKYTPVDYIDHIELLEGVSEYDKA